MNSDLFFRTVTRKTLRLWVRISILLLIIAFVFAAAALLPFYLIETDNPGRGQAVVIENWQGDVELFELAGDVIDSLQATEVWLAIFEDTYNKERRRTGLLINAWAAGIDTTKIRFVVADRIGQKTMRTAIAAMDSAKDHQITRMTLVTSLFHSGRSGKLYKHCAAVRGIAVDVVGVPHLGITRQNWFRTSYGVSLVALETLKKLYYDLFVSLPD